MDAGAPSRDRQWEFGKLKEGKGFTKLPNGYNGVFSCTDGQWRLEEVPGLTKEEIKGLYENADVGKDKEK